MVNKKKTAGRTLAVLGAAALGLTGLASVASADPAPGNIDPNTDVSLTIHKILGVPNSAGNNNGTEIDASDYGDPLAGVEFTVWQIGAVDGENCEALTWDNADEWAPAFAAPVQAPAYNGTEVAGLPTGYCVVDATGVTKSTNVDGEIVFDELVQGVYYVAETDASGATADGDPVTVASHSAPFYVTLPLAANLGTETAPSYEWIYDVHAYPKNQDIESPIKTVTGPTIPLVGQNVTWTITGKVPTLAEGVPFTDSSINDQLDSRLTYKSSVVTLNGTKIYDSEDPVTPELITFSNTPAGTLKWEFTAAGLTALKGAEGKDLVVTLVTEVNEGIGELANGGDGLVNPADYTFNGTPKPTTEAFTYWGQLQITKIDASAAKNKLAGAEFEIYAAPTDAATECPAYGDQEGTRIASGVSEATTGVVKWTPATSNADTTGSPLDLFIAASNSQIDPAPSRDFCVYETKAPAGYEVKDAVQKINVKSGDLTDTLPVEWVNPQTEGPGLPVTGSTGAIILGILGVALVGGGAVLVTRSRRQGENA